MGNQFVISQLADYTTLVLNNETQTQKVENVISLFSKASGLYLNFKKKEKSG